jgi:hypothetical protein
VHISEEDGYVGVFTGSNTLMGGGIVHNNAHVTQSQLDVLFSMLMSCPKGMRVRFMQAVRRYVPDFGITE